MSDVSIGESLSSKIYSLVKITSNHMDGVTSIYTVLSDKTQTELHAEDLEELFT